MLLVQSNTYSQQNNNKQISECLGLYQIGFIRTENERGQGVKGLESKPTVIT